MLMQVKDGGAKSASRKNGPRILFYSHDTFGLGHIRRTRTIAMALAAAMPSASILIITGSPIVGRFDFPDGVDFVRIPGVVKLSSGDYASHNMGIDITETVALRRAIIESTVETFRPDLIIVDKEPTGFRGEMLGALAAQKARGGRAALGIRDVLDDEQVLAAEWGRKRAVEAVEQFYDSIWVYGMESVYDPLRGLPLSEDALSRVRFTGYLRRTPADWPEPLLRETREKDYILVTPGGGGDGDRLIDWVLRAYEADTPPERAAVIVFGPFLNNETRMEFELRAHALDRVEVLSFDSRLERLMLDAGGVIAMGGYNTFCEILSFDKPAAIAPRTKPRAEQIIRARAAERLGLARRLPLQSDGPVPAAALMVETINALPDSPAPSAAHIDGLLDGLDVVVGLARAIIAEATA